MAATLVVACGGGADTPTPSTSSTPTTQTFLTSSTTSEPNWDQIYREIERRRHEVFANPTAATLESLDDILDPDCVCLANDRRQIQSMIQRGRRSVSAGYQVESVALVEKLGPDEVRLRVVRSLVDDFEIDGASTTVRVGPKQERCQRLMDLRQNGEGPSWRLLRLSFDPMDPSPAKCPTS